MPQKRLHENAEEERDSEAHWAEVVFFLAPRVALPFRLLECAIHTHSAKVTMKNMF